MALLLPDFKDRKCLQLDLCAHVSPEEMGRGKLKKVPKPLISLYHPSPGRDGYLGLVMSFAGEKLHVHLKLAVPERFAELPEVNSTTEDILKAVGPCLGKKIDVELDGFFRVPSTDLSPIIRSTLVETSADKVQVRMTGGVLSVRGAPIHTITWKLLEKSAKVEFVLEARTTSNFDGPFLGDALDMIESAFKAFVVRGGSK